MALAQQVTGPLPGVREIAKWCEQRAESLGTEASRQFRLIVLIVMIGLALLLVLPPLIGQIDFWASRTFSGSPAVEKLQGVRAAVQRLISQVAESTAQRDTLATDLQAVRNKLSQLSQNSLRMLEEASTALRAPMSVWEPVHSTSLRSSIGTLEVISNGSLLVAGPGINFLGQGNIYLLRSADGESFSPIDITKGSGETPDGALYDILEMRDGRIFAVGAEIGSDKALGSTNRSSLRSASARTNSHLVILRSDNSRDWSIIRPTTTEGERLNVVPRRIAQAPDDALIIGGTFGNDEGRSIAVLRSENGEEWASLAVQRGNGEPITGWISEIKSTSIAPLIAVGTEKIDGVDWMLTLQSEDGHSWTPVSPVDANGSRLKGWMTALVEAPDGSLIALSDKGTGEKTDIKFFRSEDGRVWTTVLHLTDNDGRPLRGQISSVAITPSETLVAIGTSAAIGANKVSSSIISSKNGQDWTTGFVESVSPIDVYFGLNLAVAHDGAIYASSLTEIWRGRWAPPGSDALWIDRLREGSQTDSPEGIQITLRQMADDLSQEGRLYPPGTAALLNKANDTLAAWLSNSDSEKRIDSLHADTDRAVDRQKDTLEKVEAGATQLAKALTDADELRWASRIATRIAVVALLIYLVQIVVNRYRYLQRLQGFYRARAQALYLVAADSQETGKLLENVTITDLMHALAPDGIGFDKSAEPPTQNMLHMFREVMRREKSI
ncbi:hypothetical protein AAFN88_01845 [Pelagibius sp. CAU 1746]|uniref:hypothetical protein n=1 Tax=Pelagibius sp. CAU 1746 TaxID=3140370 RepID=UPI00325B1FC6